jgi:hypothetical protein
VTSDAGTFNTSLDSLGRSLSYGGAALDVIGGLALAGGLGWTAYWATHRTKDKAPAAVAIRPIGSQVLVQGRF